MFSTNAVVPATQATNDADRGDRTFTETEDFCINANIAMEHTTMMTAQRKRTSVRYVQSIATAKKCTPTGGEPRLKIIMPRRLSANSANPGHQVQGRRCRCHGALMCAILVHVILHYSRGDAHSATAWAAPYVPGHETASTRSNPIVEDTFYTGTRQKRRGQSHQPRVWSSLESRKTRFGSRWRKTG